MSDKSPQTQEPCFTDGPKLPAPILTSLGAIHLQGSRTAFAAAYRLAAVLSGEDRKLILELSAITTDEARLGRKGAVSDSEKAAGTCLAALYLKLELERPVIVIWSRPEDQMSPPAPVTPARLKLERVQAISSTQVEYQFTPTLPTAQEPAEPPDKRNVPRTPAYRLTGRLPHTHPSMTLWALRRGMEPQIGRLSVAALPRDRGALVTMLEEQTTVQVAGLRSVLAARDEGEFQHGLRAAFSSLVRLH